MRAVRTLVVAILVLVVLAVPMVVLADGRVALVVGNSTYAHIGRLPNPENDAADMATALRRLGFEVTTAQGCGPHVAERGVAGLHPGERGGGRGADLSTPVTAWRWTA